LPFGRLDVASPRIRVEGGEPGRADEQPFVNFQIVGADYFTAMRIPLLEGRHFEWTDREESPRVAIVSRRVAQRVWNGEALGRRLQINWNQDGTGSGGGDDVWLTVIGVVDAVRFAGVHDETGLDVYAPNTQMFAGDSYFVLRTAAPPGTLTGQLRAVFDRVDAEQSFFDVATMRDRMARTLWQHRVATAVLVPFAIVALLLAVIGIFAVTSHAVAAQQREIGIRLALGATGARVGWLVARTWIVPIGIGVSLGLAGGAIASGMLAARMNLTVPAVGWPLLLPTALAVAAAAACALPVLRAVRRIAPVEALRAE
jgi:hypothetical protein